MVLWRLSDLQHARAFDGGFGLLFDGRWNTVGHAITYCSTSPSLTVLEKLVHVQDPDLLPMMAMVRYAVPDDLAIEVTSVGDLPSDWRVRLAEEQRHNILPVDLSVRWHLSARQGDERGQEIDVPRHRIANGARRD